MIIISVRAKSVSKYKVFAEKIEVKIYYKGQKEGKKNAPANCGGM